MSDPRPGLRELWKYDLALLSAIAGLYHEVIFGSARVIGRDVLHYLWPVGASLREGYLSGASLLWESGTNHGLPVIAVWAPMVFYPGQWLHALFAPLTAISVGIVLHLAIASLATLRLALRFTASRPAAWIGAFSFACSGYVISVSVGGGYLFGATLLPLSLLCFFRLAEHPTAGRVFQVAGMVALQVFCADPQTLFYEGLVLVPIILIAPGTSTVSRPRRFVLAGLATGLALALSACQWLPSVEFSKLSIRAEGLTFADSAEWAFHPLRLAQFLSPHVFGEVVPENTFWARKLLNGPYNIPWAPLVYPGLLVVSGLLVLPRRRQNTALILVCLGFFALALGPWGPLYRIVWLVVPGANAFRYPEKFMLFVSLGVNLLGAVGLGQLIDDLSSTGEGATRRRRRITIALGGLALAATALRLWLSPGSEEALGFFARLVSAQGADVLPALALARTASSLVHTAVIAAVIAAISVVGLRLRPALVAFVVPLVALADLLPVSLNQRYVAEVTPYDARPAACEAFKPGPAGLPPLIWRYKGPLVYAEPLIPQEGPRFERQREWEWNTLLANVGSMYCVRYADAYEAAGLKAYQQLWNALDDDIARRLRLFGVQYVIAAPRTLDERVFPMVFGSRSLRVLVQSVENPLPYAHSLGRGEQARNVDEAVKRLVEPTFDFTTAVVLERTAPPPDYGDALRQVTLRAHRAGDIRIDVDFSAAGFLLLQESYYPGWQATVDDQPVKVDRANATFLGLEVPAGRHAVHFVFDPPLQRIANGVTAASALLLLLAAIAARALAARASA